MQDRIYLDHASTSPMHPEVIQVMTESMAEDFGNASSIHTAGRKSSQKLEAARKVFAESIHAKVNEIIFTSGGTEADNAAILKIAEGYKERGRHIITSQVEHHAVLNPMEHLEKLGYEVTYLPVDEQGFISISDLKANLRPDTILVSLMFANNEVGTIFPVQEIGKTIKENSQAFFHTDAVQAYGSQVIDVQAMNIDLLSVSAHKINGPKGVGFLYKKSDIFLPAFVLGGNQESKHRAGTENVPGVVGFQRAVEIMLENREEMAHKYQNFKTYLSKTLKAEGIDFKINGPNDLKQALPHVFSLSFPNVESEKLLIQLDLMGVEAAAGSACTAGVVEPSHVLLALYGQDSPIISQTVRFSFGYGLEQKSLEGALGKIVKAIKKLQGDD